MKLILVNIAFDTEIEKSIKKHVNKRYIYNISKKTKQFYEEIYNNLDGNTLESINTIFIVQSNGEINNAYLTKSQRLETNGNMMCSKLEFVEEQEAITEFIKNVNVDISKDFKNGSFILYKDVPSSNFTIFRNKIIKPYIPRSICIKEQNYKENEREKNLKLHPLAQKNEYCIKAIGIQSIHNDERSEFQRDRERIVHSKAYRRLVDKAQIFTFNKGDHFRTRMTHTLEVSQIARGIAIDLNLNVDLVEAISLGHDIGHTPFGHQGERTLHNILTGDIQLISEIEKLKIGGFKHNYQSLRVLTYLEEKYIEHNGLDLTYQTLEGILKHTGGKTKKCTYLSMGKCQECDKKCLDIKNYLINGDYKFLYLDYKHATTLEGQIVNIADEIAQRGHDLDDAFAAGHIDVEFIKDLCSISEMKDIYIIIDETEKKIDKYKLKGRHIDDDNNMLRARIVPQILGFLINDIVNNSLKLMNTYNKGENDRNRVFIKEKLIKFSPEGEFINEYMDRLISKSVINSKEVSRFDAKAELIIKKLFEAYYYNPRILPDGVLHRLEHNMHEQGLNYVNFRNASPNIVNKEIDKIVNRSMKESSDLEYLSKRKLLVRNITDFISGMTDNYAINEFSSIYETTNW